MEKIKKAIENIINRETKEEIKAIKEAATFEAQRWGEYTRARNKAGEEKTITGKLTQRQQEKPIKEQKEIFIKKINKEAEKKKAKYFEELEEISQAKSPKSIKIDVDYIQSRTWGWCPKAEVWASGEYYESSRAGGCGYDKESTVTAAVLNKIKGIKKLILETISKKPVKEIEIIIKNRGLREVLGYGLGCYYLPYFEGGVGFECHRAILNKLGYKTLAAHQGRTSNYYEFEREEKRKRGKKK